MHRARRAGGRAAGRASSAALACARSTRRCRVRSPRSASHASTVPGTAPCRLRVATSRSATPTSRATATPSSRSEWPERYFVALCTTTSAPVSSGRCRIGVAKVLSTASSAPRRSGRAASALEVDELAAAGWSGLSAQHQVGARRRASARRRVGEVDPADRQPAARLAGARARRACRSRRPARRPRRPPSGTRSTTAATAAIPDAKRRGHAALEGAEGGLEHLPRRVAVAAVPDLAAGVVGRGHHERRVQRPVGLPGRAARRDGDRGGESRVGTVGRAARRRSWQRVSRPVAPSVGSAADDRSESTSSPAAPASPSSSAAEAPSTRVSCVSAGSVLAAIDRERYDVVPVGISREGRWVLAADEPDRLAISGDRLPEVEDRPAPSCSPATRPSAGWPCTSPARCPASSARSTSSCRCCTARTARTAPCRACSSWPACPTSGRASSPSRPRWTRAT